MSHTRKIAIQPNQSVLSSALLLLTVLWAIIAIVAAVDGRLPWGRAVRTATISVAAIAVSLAALGVAGWFVQQVFERIVGRLEFLWAGLWLRYGWWRFAKRRKLVVPKEQERGVASPITVPSHTLVDAAPEDRSVRMSVSAESARLAEVGARWLSGKPLVELTSGVTEPLAKELTEVLAMVGRLIEGASRDARA